MTKIKLLSFLLSLVLIYEVIKNLTIGYNKNSWNISEFLINYQGGFVRRGLLGEIIWWLNQKFSFSPYSVIIFISILCLLIFSIYFIYNLKKSKINYIIFVSILLIANPIINGFWVKKDILLVLLFIISIYFSLKNNKVSLILMNIFMIFGILIHEAMGLIIFPIITLILMQQNTHHSSKLKSLFLTAIQLLPAFIAFIIVVKYSGDALIAHKIIDSWKGIKFPIDYTLPQLVSVPAIDSISWSLSKELQDSKKMLFNFNDGIYGPLAWLFIIITIYYILSNLSSLSNQDDIEKNKTNSSLSILSAIQLLSVAPLFILGVDYSRWTFYWTSTSISLFFLIPASHITTLIPLKLYKLIMSCHYKFNEFIGNKNILLPLLIIGLPISYWSLNYYINTTSVYIIMEWMSDIIHLIIKKLT